MKNITKFILTFFITVFFSVSVFGAPYVNLKLSYDGKVHNYNEEMVYLYVNGKNLNNLPMQPIIMNDLTLVPARETFEALGAEVLWNKATSEITVTYEGNIIKMWINKVKATVNGVEYTMPLSPKLINGKTMIPVRFVSEAVGLQVNWDSKKRIVNISNVYKPPVNVTEQTTQSTTNDLTQTTTESTTQTTTEVISFGNINSIEMPNSDQNTFYIYADKKIEKYDIKKLENGFYELTINNFKTTLNQTTLDSYSEYVYKVEIEPENDNVKFIFNTLEDTIYDIFFKDDGKTLAINIGGNKISKIEKSNDGVNDTIKVYSEYKLNYEIEKNENENKILISLPKVNSKLIYEDFKDTLYIKEMKYYQDENEIFKIEIVLNENKQIQATQENEYLLFKIGSNLEENNNNNNQNPNTKPDINGKNIVIAKNPNISLNINSIKHQDNYLDKQYILDFGQDITSIISQGEHKINNPLVKNILVKNVNGSTQLTINSNKIIAVNITEDTSNIYIDIVEPKQKYKNIVVIDPGHGGHDAGTSGFGLYEKNIVLDIGNRLIKLIDNDPDIKVYSSRATDFYPSFDDRTGLGNEVGDMFVSIHINAPADSSNTGPNGTEVYWLNYNTSSSGLNSKVMAETFQKNIVSAIDTRNRGIKKNNFKVLRDSKIPAVLCEIGFVTNPQDNKKLGSDEYKQKVAEALYKSIKELFQKYPSKR